MRGPLPAGCISHGAYLPPRHSSARLSRYRTLPHPRQSPPHGRRTHARGLADSGVAHTPAGGDSECRGDPQAEHLSADAPAALHLCDAGTFPAAMHARGSRRRPVHGRRTAGPRSLCAPATVRPADPARHSAALRPQQRLQQSNKQRRPPRPHQPTEPTETQTPVVAPGRGGCQLGRAGGCTSALLHTTPATCPSGSEVTAPAEASALPAGQPGCGTCARPPAQLPEPAGMRA